MFVGGGREVTRCSINERTTPCQINVHMRHHHIAAKKTKNIPLSSRYIPSNEIFSCYDYISGGNELTVYIE